MRRSRVAHVLRNQTLTQMFGLALCMVLGCRSAVVVVVVGFVVDLVEGEVEWVAIVKVWDEAGLEEEMVMLIFIHRLKVVLVLLLLYLHPPHLLHLPHQCHHNKNNNNNINNSITIMGIHNHLKASTKLDSNNGGSICSSNGPCITDIMVGVIVSKREEEKYSSRCKKGLKNRNSSSKEMRL